MARLSLGGAPTGARAGPRGKLARPRPSVLCTARRWHGRCLARLRPWVPSHICFSVLREHEYPLCAQHRVGWDLFPMDQKQNKRVAIARAVSTALMVFAAMLSIANARLAALVLIFYPFIAGAFLIAWNPHWLTKSKRWDTCCRACLFYLHPVCWTRAPSIGTSGVAKGQRKFTSPGLALGCVGGIAVVSTHIPSTLLQQRCRDSRAQAPVSPARCSPR